ncbi:NACHT domain-containing protein [Solihabitans fulvus]|uniref:NACHT domain-containing protein n=1 Tax=Solihabitans fulvus TaxID=1892852 RepID=A0A5B2XIY5_9PSEU|nr:NACHT domain-containing protein [Solihabitans fulvus]KAA2262722.1 NACHT domain-containing protein [Solihabitans fulvus]
MREWFEARQGARLMGDEVDRSGTRNVMSGDVSGAFVQAREIGHVVIVAPPSAPSARLAAAADRLAGDVGAFWRDEQQRRQIHDPRPLRVRWRPAATKLTDHWESVVQRKAGEGGPPEVSGDLDQVADVYRRIPSQRLVVLGRAGSGKTVVAVRLALDLLAARTPNTRVPVVVSLATWNPAETLQDWLVSHLIRDHPWLAETGSDTRTSAAELVRHGWILPVLDGFDEIALGLHPAALRQLSADMPLVLTSRAKEYAAAVDGTRGVHRAAVIELTDLALDEVKDYLRLATPRLAVTSDASTVSDTAMTRWDPVLGRLSLAPHDPAAANLVAVLTTPLMVALARTIYSDATDRDPATLLDITRFGTVEELQDHLLSSLVPSVYGARPGGQDPRRSPAWNPEQAHRWLSLLAAHLDLLNSRDLAWWEMGTSLSRWSRTLVISVQAVLVFAGVTGVGNIPVDLIGTPLGLGFALRRGLVVGALHGLVGGLAFGLLYWFADSRNSLKPSPVRIRLRGGKRQLRARFTTRLKIGVTIGFVLGLAVVLMDRLVVAGLGLDDGLGGGLLSAIGFAPEVGLGVGVVLGLMAWLEAPIEIDDAVSPAGLLTVNRINVIVHMLVWAVVFGLEGWLVSGFTVGPLRSLETGLVFGLEAAFAGGLGYGLSLTAWGQWVALARIWLPLTRRLPWRLIAFLDDACQRGALRQAGAVYQFRHAQLQDHLAKRLR